MKMIQAFFLCGLLPIAACASRPVAVELRGTELLAAPCANQPPTLSDQDVQDLVTAMPDPRDRERAFWAPRDQAHRAYELCERRRADDLVSLIGRYNQIVRETR